MTSPAAAFPIRLLLDENGFVDWLVTAEPGQALVYRRGLLALDVDPRALRMSAADRANLAALAQRLRDEADQGRLHLLQRRLGPERFDYIAVAAAPAGAARTNFPAPASGRRS
jgi:hypothetical protein